MSLVDSAREIVPVTVMVNGVCYQREIPARMLLVHFLRDELKLTGTKIGCDSTNCGCCTVLVDGRSAKSCTLLAVQVHGQEITTVEGLASGDELSTLQKAFTRNHALQCGYCTAGMMMAAENLLRENPQPTREEIKRGISGNFCRCTGYAFILDAIADAAAARAAEAEKQP